MPNPLPSRHVPALPPSHPAFRPLIASIARITAEQSAAAAARLCRQRIELISEQIDSADALVKGGVTAIELTELVCWLAWRANELEGARS